MTGWVERALKARELELAVGRLTDVVGRAPVGRSVLHAERLLRAAVTASSPADVDGYLDWAENRPWAAGEKVGSLREWWHGIQTAAEAGTGFDLPTDQVALAAFRALVAEAVRRRRRQQGRREE